jgi:hypothetical protein
LGVGSIRRDTREARNKILDRIMLRIEKAILEGFIECILGHEVDIETDRMVDPAVNLGAYFSPRRTAVIIVDEIIEFGRICAVEAPV